MNVASLTSYLQRFKVFNAEERLKVKDLRNIFEQVRLALLDMTNPPNELQLAIAHASVGLLQYHKRQVFIWPGG